MGLVSLRFGELEVSSRGLSHMHVPCRVEHSVAKRPYTSSIRTKRIYQPASRSDGVRILIDRLWPRGLKKQDVHIDQWLKTLAPSTRLRQWFGHKPDRWDEFRRRYTLELAQQVMLLGELRSLTRRRRITLLYSARDEEYNDAVALRHVLIHGRRLGPAARGTRSATPPKPPNKSHR